MVSKFIMVPTKELKRNELYDEITDAVELNKRKEFVESVRAKGIVSPLIATPGMTILSGYQRHSAALELEMKEVPVVVYEMPRIDTQRLHDLICSNFHQTTRRAIAHTV